MWETTGDEVFQWRKRYYGLHIFWPEAMVCKQNKKVFMMDLFLTTYSFSLHNKLTDGLEWCGLLVDYCDVFISCLDSHSDGTHSLQMIHW